MTEKSTLSRRGFLKGALGAAFVAGAGTAAAAFHVDRVDHWDETYDMVIVGSGFAGLATAYQAGKEGVKRILILEKMEAYGGNSALCGALMCMPCTKMQKEKGIEDSPERLVEDMIAAGRGFNHRDLTQTMAENAHKVFDMLIECGVELQDKVIRLGGHSVPRAHLPKVPSGGAIVVPMHKYVEKAGVEFRNRTNVVKIVMNDGHADGLVVQTNYDWHDGSFDTTRTIRATRGIVAATGSWGQDRAFVTATMPAYKDLECTSQPGSTADMIKALLEAGRYPSCSTCISWVPGPLPTKKERGRGASSRTTPLPKAWRSTRRRGNVS